MATDEKQMTKPQKIGCLAAAVLIIGIFVYVGIADWLGKRKVQSTAVSARNTLEQLGRQASELLDPSDIRGGCVLYEFDDLEGPPRGILYLPKGHTLKLAWKGKYSGHHFDDVFWQSPANPGAVTVIAPKDDEVSVLEKTESAADITAIVKAVLSKSAEIHLAVKVGRESTHLCRLRLADVAFKVAEWVEKNRFVWRYRDLGDVELTILVEGE